MKGDNKSCFGVNVQCGGRHIVPNACSVLYWLPKLCCYVKLCFSRNASRVVLFKQWFGVVLSRSIFAMEQ